MSANLESIVEIPLDVIERGFFQPREYFSQDAMEATKRSIQEKGQKYPAIVRPILTGNPLFDPAWRDTHYELADGERRFRCCKELGFKTLKVLIRSLSDEEMLDYTLTTNDSLPLNPIEKATVFSRLAKEFGRSQADIAKSFSLKQQQVSEYIRLLELPKEIQDLTARAVISVRHARELLKIEDKEKMAEIAFEIQKKSISTRQLSKIVKISDEKSNEIDKDDEKYINIEEKSEKIIKNINITRSILLESNKKGLFFWLEALNYVVMSRKMRLKLHVWLSYQLGSGLKPEQWLAGIEISIIGGSLLACGALWLPLPVLAAVLGALASVFLYLAIT